MAADYISSCLEEIALEGLDGITIEALWVRLEDRQPPFPLKLDDNSKSYLWRLISVQKDLAFYELPNARGGLILADRFKHTDPSTGIFLELENYPEDIYPLEIISDKNILGSCTTYRTRLDITHLIRTEDDQCIRTHQEVLRRWDRKLVIVASQEARTASLYGPEVDPSLVLPEKHYCILERIGRSRRQGEITHGKHSLLIFKEPSKTIFYLRKGLIRHGLIKVQPFNQKLANGINGAGKCLHLKRFFVEYKPIYLGLLENLTQRLSQKPKQSEALTVIRSEMKMRDASFKKLYQFGQKYVKTEMIRHKDFYPDSTKEEYMIKVGTKERFVRVLTLKKLYKYSSEAKSDDEEGSDGEDGGAAGRKDRTWNRVVELPLLHQAYQFARSKGEIGASQSDFREAFCVSKLDARLMARNLDRLGMVKTILQDQGKQRVQMFVAKEHLAGSSLHKKLQEEKDKIVKLTLPRFDARDSPFSTPTGTPLSSRATSPAPGTSGLARGDSHLDLSSLDDSVPLIDTDNDSEKYHFKKKGAHVTYRLLKRANQILKAVQEARLVDNIYYIQKKIIEDETAEGYTCRCDKKSLLRLIERLAREGQIKSIKTLIKYGNEEKQLHFLCDPSISATDEIVTSAIEAAKLRHIAVSKEYSKEIRKGDKASEPNLEHSDLNIPNYGLLTSHLTMRDMKYDSDAGRRYGYKPRMQRLQLIHQLLFYLVHDYDLERAKELAETAQAVPPIYGATPDCLADANLDLKVYCEDMTWKRFMPPLPKHREYEDGWCLIGDVLLRLPVSVFCQIIRVNFKITGLEDLLNHPVYTNLTVGKLPSHMRQQLMIERKYIFSFYSNCISLCLMGLISFGKREWKQKEQIFVHVNRRATLVDTTETDEPLDSRPEEYFEFSDMADLDNYWFRLQWICLNTPLDAIVINADPVGTNHSHAVKIERFTAFLDGHLPIEISDDGTLPGNRLGAAGLDSTFFGHLRRNWSSSSGHLKSETLISEGKRRLVEEGRNVVKKPRSIKRSYSDSEYEDPSTNVPDNFPESATAGSILEAMSQGGLEIPDEDDADTSPSTIPVTWAEQPKPSTSSAKRPEIMTKKVIVEGGKAPLGGKGVKRKAAGSAKHGEQSPKTKDTTLPGSLIKQESETTDTAQKGTKVPIEPVAQTRGGELVLDKTSHVSTVPERVKRTSPVMIDLTASDPLQEVSQSTAETVPPGVIEIAPISDTGEGTPAKKRKVDEKDVKEGEKTPESGVKTPKSRGKGPPPKRKNEIDSIDRDALKKMTKERVMWTTQEDSLLLLCEVASQILGGIRRDFLVQFTIVRDLMHKNFTTSQDKTSKACQRRIRYIMKNSETMANVNMYKGEALQDKAIVDDFLVGKKYSRTTKKKAMLNEVFVQLVERLRDKFKSSAERAPLKLPDTLEEVYRRYTLSRPTTASKSKHQTATSEKDIHFSVLHNVIHSAMVIQDKTGHANELYHVFSQYPDNLLQAVFNQMRADGIVTKIKAYAAHKDPGGKRTMPGPSVAIGNYQMAQRYTYKWFSRYRKAIFIQAYLLLEKFCSDGEKTKAITRGKKNTEGQAKAPQKDLQKIDGKVKESVERTADQEETADRPAGEEGVTEKVEKSSQQEEDKENAFPTNMMPMKDEGVHVAITVSLMIQRKCVMHTCIPDQVIVVESQYMSNQKQKKRKKKLTDIEKELHLGTASDEEEEALIEEAEKARAAQEAAASTLDADWENKKTTSRTSLVLFRSQYANGPISVRMLAPQDHIVINSCAVSLELDPTFNRNNYPKPVHPFADTSYDNRQYHHHWNNAHMWIHPKTCLRLLSSVRKLEPTEIDLNAFYHACWNKWKFSARKMTKIRDIFEDVNEKGPIGMTRDVMMEKYGHIRGLHRMLGAFSEHHVEKRDFSSSVTTRRVERKGKRDFSSSVTTRRVE